MAELVVSLVSPVRQVEQMTLWNVKLFGEAGQVGFHEPLSWLLLAYRLFAPSCFLWVGLLGSRAWMVLVVQWLRICLAKQGTPVRSLVWEDPTCCGGTKPVRHNYWAHGPQQEESLQWEALTPQLEHSPHSPQLEEAQVWWWRPSAAKNKMKK